MPHGEKHDDESFEDALTREILISERLRVTLLAAIPAIGMLIFLAVSAVSSDLTHKLFRVELDRVRVGTFLGLVAIYEFFALWQVEQLIKTQKKPPRLRRFVNALIETSLPTCVSLYYMTVVSPVEALLLPPTFIYFVFILLSTLRLNFALSAFTGLVAAVEYAILSIAVIDGDSGVLRSTSLATIQHHLGKAIILLVSGIAAGFVARRLRRGFENTLRSVQDRNRVIGVFGQHVSPAVVERLLAERAGSRTEVKDVCVMFLDVRNFTAFCEKRTPEEVVGYLNSLFELMILIINEHGGIVNKFLGDGFMAVFGAPLSDTQAAAHAVDAALAIVAKIEESAELGIIPPTRVGIGVHSGMAVIGSVGSVARKEYTVIGDVVNVASRIEALNKERGSQILVTERVWEAAGKDSVAATPTEPISIRGREVPVILYQLA